jgi:hypothetical protein
VNGAVIKEFLVGLGFQVDEQGLKKFEDGIKGATIAVAAIGAASMAAAGAVVAFVAGVADRLDAVGDSADRIGTTVDELMRLQYAATLSGSSAEAATATMENLGRIAGEAAQGIGRGAKVFADLGLSAKDASGNLKPTTQLLGEVGEKIKDLSRGEQMAVLGKLGIDPTMIGAITGGMQELGAEFDALYSAAGVDLNQAAEASGLFNDALDRLRMTFDAVKTAVAVKFMPQITRGIDTVRKFLIQNLPKIINAITPVINIILRIAEAFITLAGRIASGAMTVIGWFVKLNDATGGWAGYILMAAAAWKYLNLAFLKTPLGMLIALAAAVALLIDDFLTFKEGGDSLIDWGSGFGLVMQGVTAALTGFLAYLALSKAAVIAMTIATNAWTAATAIANGIMNAARIAVLLFNLVLYANPIGLVVAAIGALIAAGALLIANWDTVKAWFASFFDWLVEGFNKIAEWGGKVAGVFGFGGGGAPASADDPQPHIVSDGAGIIRRAGAVAGIAFRHAPVLGRTAVIGLDAERHANLRVLGRVLGSFIQLIDDGLYLRTAILRVRGLKPELALHAYRPLMVHRFIQSFFGPVEMCILNVCADEQIFLTADAYQHWFSSDQALIQAMEEILQSAYLHLQKK